MSRQVQWESRAYTNERSTAEHDILSQKVVISPPESIPERLVIPDQVKPAARLLAQAYEYAHALERDPWDFAVEIQELMNRGAGISEIRWLVYAGLAEHGREVTMSNEPRRGFQHGGNLTLDPSTCLVLSALGASIVKPLENASTSLPMPEMRSARPNSPNHQQVEPALDTLETPQKPTWDSDRHELRWGIALVKQFKLSSPNQETILAVFEEEDWPPRIDDPLPPTPDIDSRRRLNDTIKSLNRHQRAPLIRFQGDGTGEGVRWDSVSRAVEMASDDFASSLRLK